MAAAFADMVAEAFAERPGGPLKTSIPPPTKAGAKPVTQMLTPMQLWDWPAAATGTMSFQQQALVDCVPASLAPSDLFSPSGNSFSTSYVNFLSIIDKPQFALQSKLESILAACRAPDDGAMTAPDGWAKAPDGVGIMRWRLAYGVSTTPKDWATQTALGRTQSMVLPLAVGAETTLSVIDAAGAARIISLQGKTSQVTVSAGAWGKVDVFPGAWYDGSLLNFARNGPFVRGMTADGAYDSMLSGRVASIIVADNPALTISLPASEVATTGKLLESATAIEVGGFRFRHCVARAPASPQPASAPTSYVAQANSGPWIISVMLERFA